MNKFYIALLMIFSSVFLTTHVSANVIQEMVMKVHINEDGSVDVTEERRQNMTEGTENYMVFRDKDMGEVEISHFSVEGFEEVEHWNSEAGLEGKAGKYGIIDKFSSKELVFGIGEYGVNNYTVHYTLENMVRNLEDGQSLFWNFDTFTGLWTNGFSMEITSDLPFEDIKYWGFGFNGDIELIDDTIYWDTNSMLSEGNNVIVLIHFPPDTYSTSVEEDKRLEEEREGAISGSIYEDYLDNENSMPTWLIVVLSIGGALFGITTITGIVMSMKVSKYLRAHGNIKPGSKIMKMNKGYEEETAPNIEDYAGIVFFVKHITNEAFEALFQVYLMKWNDEGRISIALEEGEGWFQVDKTTITIHNFERTEAAYLTEIKAVAEMIKKKEYSGDYEVLMWRFLIEMANEDGIIDQEAMTKFSKKHAKEFGKLVDYLNEYSLKYLSDNGYLELEKHKKFGMNLTVKRPTEAGLELINHLAQYKNYLQNHDEEMLNNPFDETVLKDHLKWATLLGEHSKYHKLLEKLHKDDESSTNVYPYYLYHYGSQLSRESISTGLGQGGMSSSMSTAATGGGGSTGVGGGGGAGGGGGGGAR